VQRIFGAQPNVFPDFAFAPLCRLRRFGIGRDLLPGERGAAMIAAGAERIASMGKDEETSGRIGRK